MLAAVVLTAHAQERQLTSGAFPLSGYHYMGTQIQELQDDEFLNPGRFAVDHGLELWLESDGSEGLSCHSCHGDASVSMSGVAARYPQFDENRRSLVNLEGRINEMRTEFMKAEPLELESEEMLALAAYLTFQSLGEVMDVDVSGEAARYLEEGREYYMQRRGQLDLACSQCHDERAGMMLRGDRISQGHVNGFPVYRLIWRSMGSRHRMFRWCNWAVRAEPRELGSDEYLSLELYLAWRGRGLNIESPAVRP